MAIGIATLAAVAAALTVYGRWRWAGLTTQLVARLEAARTPLQPARFNARELEALPPPVRRYFTAALTDQMPLVVAASVEHSGTFNMGETADQWKPFTSIQRVVTKRPGFVWDGRIGILPGLSVYVHDAYVAGEGILHPAVAGLVSLMDLRGSADVAEGELMRFFAEAAWYPTALLPSQGVRWEAVDESSAHATLIDDSVSLTMTFTFGIDGLIESVRAERRGRTVAGKIVPTPWEGRWTNYRTQDGMRIPMTGEVAWLLPEGRKPYWRGTITALRYEFAK
jgi:hypothetical protein